MGLPKLVCLCCTYMRPQLLSDMILHFEMFDYPVELKQLIILDDIGQYPSCPSGESWEVVSVNKQFKTLGEKRNYLFDLSGKDADGIVIMDDDDGYCSWTLQAHASAIVSSDVSCPSFVFSEYYKDRIIRLEKSNQIFHGSWCYTPDAFIKAGKYSRKDSGEDADLMKGFKRNGLKINNPCEHFPPYYFYRWQPTGSYHISGLSKKSIELLKLDGKNAEPVDELPKPCGQNWTLKAREFLGLMNGISVSDAWKERKNAIIERIEK